MANDGYDIRAKSVPFEGGTWDFIDMVANGNVANNELYARVAAVFQAVNKSARAAANVPFALVDIKTGDDYDVSWMWENKVQFLPRPKDLIRRVRQSLIMTNMGYLRMGKNVLRMPKKLHFVIPTSIKINTDDKTGDLKSLERIVSGQVTHMYAPDDMDLMRFWWLDEKTELIPTDDTEFKAIMNAAGILYWSDFFTANFYKRGGVKPTLIAMKGMVSNGKKEEEEKSWGKFLLGLGKSAIANAVRVFNAETLDVKAFGDGLGDLKDTPVYKQALENIAIGLDMPLSILLSNSANRATADVEYMQWQKDGVYPWVEFICDIFNDQRFTAMGLRMEPRPENTEDSQDESARVQAFTGFGDGFAKYPDAETFLAAADTFGFELDDDMQAAVTKHYKKKEENAVTVAESTQPIDSTAQPDPTTTDEVPQDEVPAAETVKAWTPTIDQLNDLRVWRDVCLRRMKKGETLEFEYQHHYEQLPAEVVAQIKSVLVDAKTADEIKAAFEVSRSQIVQTETSAVQSDLLVLAAAINKLADK